MINSLLYLYANVTITIIMSRGGNKKNFIYNKYKFRTENTSASSTNRVLMTKSYLPDCF